MPASRLVEVTDDEINCFKENAKFSNNHLDVKNTKTIIHLAFGDLLLISEYRSSWP